VKLAVTLIYSSLYLSSQLIELGFKVMTLVAELNDITPESPCASADHVILVNEIVGFKVQVLVRLKSNFL
jgi:hypothetical protein